MDYEIHQKTLQKYILENLETSLIKNDSDMIFDICPESFCDYDLEEFLKENAEKKDFQKVLFNFIDKKNLKDSEVYNKAFIDRRLFSKIRTDNTYHPSKETVIKLGIALRLTIEELEELLQSASFSLPKNNTFDLIIRYCVLNKIYNIFTINIFLEEYNCKILEN